MRNGVGKCAITIPYIHTIYSYYNPYPGNQYMHQYTSTQYDAGACKVYLPDS